jgi:hypothetical protein
MKWLKWFLAGALAVPLGHQIALLLCKLAGLIDRAPFSMDPTKPFGVPSWLSLAFWGGVWGLPLGLVLLRARGPKYWIIALLFGAIAPTLVAGLVVAPLKGIQVGGNPKLLVVGLIVNGVWGLVSALFYRLMAKE